MLGKTTVTGWYWGGGNVITVEKGTLLHWFGRVKCCGPTIWAKRGLLFGVVFVVAVGCGGIVVVGVFLFVFICISFTLEPLAFVLLVT